MLYNGFTYLILLGILSMQTYYWETFLLLMSAKDLSRRDEREKVTEYNLLLGLRLRMVTFLLVVVRGR